MSRHTKKIKNKNSDIRPIIAAILASLIVFAFGLTYHTLADRLAAPVNDIHIVPEVLERLPMEIADWIGKDVPMDEAIARATGTDTYINRYYSRNNGMESVSLFVGCSVSVFENAIHRPEICYTRNGWTFMNRLSSELILDSGIKLPYSIFRFSRGVLIRQESMVLHYYIVNGQYYEEIFPLQAKLWRLGGSADYIARVMIVAPVEISTIETAKRLVSSFAVDSAPLIADLFTQIRKDQIADSTGRLEKGDSLQ